jgi:hypothetical protein
MSGHDHNSFDKLVDGELSASERRELLTALDSQPDGWRRCALAFLEAQAWRQEMGGLLEHGAVTRPTARTTAVPSDTRAPGRDRGVFWLTVAASLFIAFTLGLALRDLPHPHQPATPNPFNSQVAATDTVRAVAPQKAAPSADALTLWVRDEGGRAHPLRVPLVDAAAVDRQLGMQFQSGLPAEVRDQLRQRGYQVESKQRYAPLWLENGRPLIVPVEDTKIVPVSNRVY